MSGQRRARLDTELVRRGLADSRRVAQDLIARRRVTIDGAPAHKPATQVARDAQVVVRGTGPRWVSRGGDKLDGALSALALPVSDRICLDAGASTGGFTDVLLARGARTVFAVDVGYGQLAWRLRTDPRVVVRERVHVRDLTRDMLDGVAPGLVVADLSFIGLATVLPALGRIAAPEADWCCLVKPQFEAGRRYVGRGGVVRDDAGWRTALDRVAAAARAVGLAVVDGVVSQVPGPAGNIEFFLRLRADGLAAVPALHDRLVADGRALRDSSAG